MELKKNTEKRKKQFGVYLSSVNFALKKQLYQT